MSKSNFERRNAIPIIYVKGNHYEIGYDVGRTFRHIIQSYLEIHGPLNKCYLPIYETPDGKRAYDLTLASVKKNFPQYIEEIEGTAEGANVPFHKLFLLHMDEILLYSLDPKYTESCAGCSTVFANNSQQKFLGHNEDALAETLSHFYFVSAHVITKEPRGKWNVKEEKFTSLCYAGLLPGFTMSYNQHGFIFSVNVIRVKNMQAGKTPRSIITRALLGASSFCQVKNILTDSGTGIGDGVSINFTFLNDSNKILYNAEAGPSDPLETDSLISIDRAKQGEHFYHCNRYLRLQCQEVEGLLITSSKHREEALSYLPAPKTYSEVLNKLGDTSDQSFPVFRETGIVRTIVTGIFNLDKATLAIYTDNPKTNDPILELPVI